MGTIVNISNSFSAKNVLHRDKNKISETCALLFTLESLWVGATLGIFRVSYCTTLEVCLRELLGHFGNTLQLLLENSENYFRII